MTTATIPDGLRRVIEETPWLLSPLALAKHDLGSDYLITPHTRLFSDTCLDLAYGKADNCILNAPFRSSKTLTATKYFAAHHLIWHPTAKVATLAYGQQLADEFGWDVREIIRRHGQVMNVRIRRDSSAKANFRIDKYGGDYTAVGRGGALMGKGYSLGIADDLIKDAGEALSPTISESVWHWFLSTFLSRRNPGAKVLVNMVRWGIRDITGRILAHAKATGTPWHHVTLRAEAEPDDILGRRPGELLWPPGSPMHTQTLKNIRDVRPTRWYGPNYQQRAVEEDGAFFKPRKWPHYEDRVDTWAIVSEGRRRIFLKRDCTILTTCDWAWSQKDTADHSAIGTFALLPGPERYILILDVVSERYALHELARAIAAVCRRWRPSLVGIEQGHPSLHDDVREQRDIPEPTWLPTQGKPKLTRAIPAITLGESHKIFLPEDRTPSWIEPFLNQLASFTGLDDDSDDMVDMLAWCAIMAQRFQDAYARAGEAVPELLGGGQELWQ